MPRFGVLVPNVGEFGDAQRLAELARAAEAAGWDGVFIWDHLQLVSGYAGPVCDPWVALTAMALATERVQLGPLVTPLPRYRIPALARTTVTLDHLCGGRLILGIGLGGPADAEYAQFGDDGDAKTRAAQLDEGLEVLTGLWRGAPYTHVGRHYTVREAVFQPPPLQQPRIPIWLAGIWPSRAPLRRAARWDGLYPGSRNAPWASAVPLDELRELVAYTRAQRPADAPEPFDIVVGGQTDGQDRAADAARVAEYAAAGVTWWLENRPGYEHSYAAMLARVRLGPPVAS